MTRLPTRSSEAGERIFAGLNPEQLKAVQAVTGPVVILAGAGSGKTTTITRRIANQVRTGAFAARSILAVTFTTKAAGELVARLEDLGVPNVQARTFHSAALRQVRLLGQREVDVLESKMPILLRVRSGLPRPFRDRSVADLATEIERAKNSRLTPETYDGAGNRSGLPPEVIKAVFAEYERQKRSARKLDFEDLLEEAIRLFENDALAVQRFRDACRAITVDEYQDVNLLQQTLLDAWLGDRDDVCVVGDDYQAIFGFTGASPRYLIAMRDRFPHARIIKLETNYRSTKQILAVANRLAPALGGIDKTLRAHNGDGPEPAVRQHKDSRAEVAAVVGEVKRLLARGVEPQEVAILYRINARSTRFEMPLHEAGIPFQVAKGGFLEREAGRGMLQRLARAGDGRTNIAELVQHEARDAGFVVGVDERDVGAQEYTRQLDLGFFIDLAATFADGSRTIGDFLDFLREEFGAYEDSSTRAAVRLSTFHSAKGLEWDAVFMPALADRELPWWRSIEEGNVDEERRLFYVGLTRARRYLYLSHTQEQKPSPFLDAIAPAAAPRVRRSKTTSAWSPRHAAGATTGRVRSAPPPIADADVPALLAALPSPWSRAGDGRPAPRIKNGRDSQPWTDDEDRLLAHFHEKAFSDAQIADQLGRRAGAIRSRLRKLRPL
jgi:DNA helicase-2/ATP-dependent DNA helicase PcrA